MGSRPEDPRAPSGVTDPDAAEGIEERVERTRGKIWDDYRRRLEGAWKTPPGILPPVPAQVGPGPSSTVAAVESPDPATRARRIEREGEASARAHRMERER